MSRILNALGMARRAGAAVIGTPMIVEALRGKKKPEIVFEASDTSDGTHKKLTDKCAFYGVAIERLSESGEALAAAVGKTGSVAAVAVTDKNLSELCKKALSEPQA